MKTIANKEILMAADFAGCPLKNEVKEYLISKGWKVTDIGVQNPDDPEDPKLMFHRIGLRAGSMITEKEFERALLFCGTGMGIHIAASKCPGVHAGVVESVPAALRAITGNGVNVLAMGAFYVAPAMAKDIVDAYLGAELGLLLIEAEEAFDLAALERKIPTGIRWEGDGQIMIMRRTLDSGEEMLIIGNIESDDTLTGKLHWGEKTYDVELTSGELAFLGGPLEQYRTPAGDSDQLTLPLTADAKFLSPNIIPLQRWENEQGKSVTLTPPESRLPYEVELKWCDSSIPVKYNEHSGLTPKFRFRADAALPDLRLLVSKAFFEHLPVSLEMDGKVLEVTCATEVLDDDYLGSAIFPPYQLPINASKGKHTLRVQVANTLGNQLDGYKAPSGILKTPYIRKDK